MQTRKYFVLPFPVSEGVTCTIPINIFSEIICLIVACSRVQEGRYGGVGSSSPLKTDSFVIQL